MSALPRRLGRVVVLSETRGTPQSPPDPALERVLAGRTLGVLFQPLLERRGPDEASRWAVGGVEALVRAYGEHGGSLRLDRLLPVIESAGLMHRLFLFVLAETLAAARSWERRGLMLDVAVNLHAGALQDDALPRFLSGLLHAADFAPERLTLELTESEPIADLRRAAHNLRRLRRHGVRTALDDFGAGFSTPMRLAWLECDELKIDKALVLGLEHCDEQRCVVQHLIELAHGRGMRVCAEGVETAAVLTLLECYGCDRVQGFHVSRPIDGERVCEVATHWHASPVPVAPSASVQLSLPGLAPDARN